MKIDDYLKLVQIVFYAAMAIVAVLTYLKAKKTLLNSINTEYHKHVINALIELSNELYSEFDEDSEMYWMKDSRINDVIKEINDEFIENKKEILKSGNFEGGIPVLALEKRLMAQIRRYKSEPFLPEIIRHEAIDLLENRFQTFNDIYCDVIENYRQSLAAGKHIETLDTNDGWVHNQIIGQLYERGCGISQIEDAVHKIRLNIKVYLDKFNPF